MPLPFNGGKPTLANNKKTAKARLNHLGKKFKINPKYHTDYTKFTEEIISKGMLKWFRAKERIAELGTFHIKEYITPRSPEK